MKKSLLAEMLIGILASSTACPLLFPSMSVYASDRNVEIYRQHVYQRIDNDLTWNDAERACEAVGGHLVTITSEGEQQIVQGMLRNQAYESYWIGGKVDVADNAKITWVTGESSDYVNWNPHEPNDIDAVYMQIYSEHSPSSYNAVYGKWDNTWSDGDHGGGITREGYICEWESQNDYRLQGRKPAKASFSDLSVSAYYYDAVQWAVAQGIASGTSSNSFSPNAPCTRGQTVTFLYRLDNGEPVSASAAFADVKKGDYYYNAVEWAVANGIANGTTVTRFSPNKLCSRAEAVTFLWRMAGSPTVSSSVHFTDVTKDDYYYDAVCWAVSKGIASGTSASTFSPNQPCTRGQLIMFLYRFN